MTLEEWNSLIPGDTVKYIDKIWIIGELIQIGPSKNFSTIIERTCHVYKNVTPDLEYISFNILWDYHNFSIVKLIDRIPENPIFTNRLKYL